MIIGLDVGGTNIDTVLVGKGGVVNAVKKSVDYDKFLESIVASIKEVSKGILPNKIKKIVLSTTLSTNTIVEGKNSRVGLIIEQGPGLSLEINDAKAVSYYVPGYIDHRGREAHPLNIEQVKEAKARFLKQGIEYAGVIGKFSVRNPLHEQTIYEILKDDFEFVSLGHTLSGELNFPRRVNTAFLNSSIYKEYKFFIDGVKKALNQMKFDCPVYVLKADGGSIDLNESKEIPAETILSGPAASIIGATAYMRDQGDFVVLDIGGTTTDISFFADGAPLYEPRGVEISEFKTLIKGLYSRSIGVGGDSIISLEKGRIRIGPRKTTPAAFGGDKPTPTDAMRLLGFIEEGSASRAQQALQPIAQAANLRVDMFAESVIETMCEIISDQVKHYLKQVNSRPVYTIHELLYGKKLKPKKAVVMGGPARSLKQTLSKRLGLEVELPRYYSVSNALGAALSRTTAELTLVVDTEKGQMVIGEEGYQTRIPASFTLEDARKFILERLLAKARKLGFKGSTKDLHIVEEEKFNMVRGFYTTGKLIKLKARIKPGLEEAFFNE